MNLRVTFGKFTAATTGNKIQERPKREERKEESQENLSSTRFIQDTATNWAPKAIFSRSKADFAEMSFLEFLESAIFYFASPILGEKLFRNKVFKNLSPKPLREIVNKQIQRDLPVTWEEMSYDDAKSFFDMLIRGAVTPVTALDIFEDWQHI